MFDDVAKRVVAFLQTLGEDAGVGGGRHEICVSEPAGDDVPVEVVFDACACGASEVSAYIEPFRFIGFLEPADAVSDEFLEFEELFVA